MTRRTDALWTVAKDRELPEYKPWYAHDRGGWFGAGLPGKHFQTWREAYDYACRMIRILS